MLILTLTLLQGKLQLQEGEAEPFPGETEAD